MVISRLVLKLGVVRFATSFLVVLLANVLNRVLIVDLRYPRPWSPSASLFSMS